MWAQWCVGAIAVYGALMLVWQFAAWIFRLREARQGVYFVVITENAEQDIEGLLRRLAHRCRNMDRETHICLIDVQSTDLTVPIAERFSRQVMPIDLFSAATKEEAMGIAEQVGTGHCIRCIYQVQQGAAMSTSVQG